MNTITDQLAGALRALREECHRSETTQVTNAPRGLFMHRADEALAAYEAQLAAPRIRFELESTAMGRGYFGNALNVAMNMPCVDEDDRAVLNRWATGSQNISSDHIRLQEIAAKITPAPQERPRIGIKMEGGAIQNVFADTEASIYVIEYDVEDAAPADGYEDENHAVCQLEQDGGHTAECVLSRYSSEVSPHWFSRMDAALATRTAELDEEQESAEALRP